MKMPTDYIQALDLQPHPEGGWFRETYRAGEDISEQGLPSRYEGSRPMATGIYFLLTSDTFSALHRLKSDEQWHFYAGDPLTVHIFEPEGEYRIVRLGDDPDRNESFQAVVPAGCWFGATVDGGADAFALVGCTVAPGFDFEDFEMGRCDELVPRYPRHRALIERLTRL
ncbi:MAG: cupin domain-containing protein [Desulfuromonadales bacterium]